MKKAWLAIALGIILTAFPAAIVSAHTESSDGKISAFLHIPPDDRPQAGKLNTIHVYFNDQDFRFTTEGCFCKIKVNQGKQVLYSGDLIAIGQRIGQAKVFLPEDNYSYSAVVTGVPKTGGFFQPFKLDYDIDVGRPIPAKVSSNINPRIYLLISGVAAGIVLWAIVIARNRSKIRRGKEDK